MVNKLNLEFNYLKNPFAETLFLSIKLVWDKALEHAWDTPITRQKKTMEEGKKI